MGNVHTSSATDVDVQIGPIHCPSCGQFAGAVHQCPVGTLMHSAAKTIFGANELACAKLLATGPGEHPEPTGEQIEDACARLAVEADARERSGELDPAHADRARAHLAGSIKAVDAGVMPEAADAATLIQLANSTAPDPQLRAERAEREFAQAKVAVGIATLKHRKAPDIDAVNEALAARRIAHRELTRGQALLASATGPSSASHAGPSDEDSQSSRCPDCGQFAGEGHNCPTPEGMPAADYADLRGSERTKAMLGDLEEAVASIVESGQLSRWLDAMSSNGMNRWSANNRLLAVMQMLHRGHDLEGLHLMGFRQWEQMDRHVNKGEKAVWILAPMPRKITEEDANGDTITKTVITGFKPVPVYDVSQTSGKPLAEMPLRPPPGEATPGTVEGLEARIKAAGYTYELKEIPDCNPQTGAGTQGYTDPRDKHVVIDSRLSPAHKSSVLAHELAHIQCGHIDDGIEDYRQHRGRKETEAEMTAYMVSRARGMSKDSADSFAPGYIAGWSKGDKRVIREAMDQATKAFNKIMDGDWPA